MRKKLVACLLGVSAMSCLISGQMISAEEYYDDGTYYDIDSYNEEYNDDGSYSEEYSDDSSESAGSSDSWYQTPHTDIQRGGGERETPDENGQIHSYLTGQLTDAEIALQRPVAVMINNIINALPQSGIENASVIYEAPVEGEITRMMAIFDSVDGIDKIGPVRSCRDYYIDWALEFDAIYVHYGQAVYAYDLLNSDMVNNISGLQYQDSVGELNGYAGEDVFFRSSDRVAPHNAYTDFSHLQAGIQSQGYSQDYKEDYNGHFQFAPEGTETTLDDGVSANVVKLDNFAYNHPWFEYNAETKEYSRFQFNAPHIDQNTGNQLTCENIILQYSNYVPYDPNGYLNVDTQSGGEGKYITRGKAIDIHWTKDSQWGITHYYDSNNQEIQLNPGKTWVEIVLNDSVGSVSLQ